MAKVRNLIMERTQENPLMQLPIHTSFISLFLIQPVCYTRLATFSGIVEIYNVRYTCTLTGGFLNGEELMLDDYSDQHRFSIPITSVTLMVFRFHCTMMLCCLGNSGSPESEATVLFGVQSWI